MANSPSITWAGSRRGLTTKWPISTDLTGSGLPFRFEGEIADVIVYGDIPSEIDGTFYRISLDRFVAKHDSVPIDGDGLISAFRINDGHVDFKINTNVMRWGKKLLVLEEAGNPHEIDPDTLETLRYDPFVDQIKAKAFTAHPKIDPFTNELVVFAYEAKGPATKDIVTYSLDGNGVKTEELWIKAPWATITHDCVITENWLVLMLWPYETSLEKMKSGGSHWYYTPDRPACFLVVPRRKEAVAGWSEGEFRVYNWKHCMNIHSAGGWEDENGLIHLESTRVHGNVFPFFPPADGATASAGEAKADFVRWTIDPRQASDSWLPDPELILDLPSEFPRIDERLMSKKYKIVFLNAFVPQKGESTVNVFHGLNGLAMINTETGAQSFYYPGENCFAQEPTFIPRNSDSPEGDGWVMALIEDRNAQISQLVFLDTRDFEQPIAVAVLPFRIKSQVHGNWVDAKDIGARRSLVNEPEVWPLSHKGALEPL
ncbi:hypothetical protein LTR09_012534 [Extremus antarcticus]|uniref:Uncharacterized protein n=1 Tax=Extremus antarcticus TaxID=702011 RepID=A0AAJ0D9W6_9PEZI|nr:hypothetical protein LTR09_012534 [Extremus antarcticus]